MPCHITLLRTGISALQTTAFLAALSIGWLGIAAAGEPRTDGGWKPLFNGKDLEGWHIVIRKAKSDDPDHLVQIEEGAIHMYKDAPEASAQPSGYIVTENEYSNYHLRLEYKWGAKRFAPRAHGRRDAGILYHVVGPDGVWPRSIECQIQEEDVGDIFTVNTRVTALVDSKTTNLVSNVITNEAGKAVTNQVIKPVFLPLEHGGIPFSQGLANGIRRVVRSPMNEHEGWNTVEVMVHGDEATYVVNGKVNNHATKIQQMVGSQWVALTRGKIALQLEFAEVYYRNVQIKELSE
jgi:hypothetical protein